MTDIAACNSKLNSNQEDKFISCPLRNTCKRYELHLIALQKNNTTWYTEAYYDKENNSCELKLTK